MEFINAISKICHTVFHSLIIIKIMWLGWTFKVISTLTVESFNYLLMSFGNCHFCLLHPPTLTCVAVSVHAGVRVTKGTNDQLIHMLLWFNLRWIFSRNICVCFMSNNTLWQAVLVKRVKKPTASGCFESKPW